MHGCFICIWPLLFGLVCIFGGKYLTDTQIDNRAPLRVIDQGEFSVFSIAVSPDGKTMISVGGDLFKPGLLRIWNTSDWKAVRDIRDHRMYVWKGLYSPDGKYFVAGGSFGDARLYDGQTFSQLAQFQCHEDSTMVAFAFSQKNSILVSGQHSSERCVKLWDLRTFKQLAILKGVNYGHDGSIMGKGEIECVTFNLTEEILAVADGTDLVKLWNTKTYKPMESNLKVDAKKFSLGGGIISVQTSKDGKWLAGGIGDTGHSYEGARGYVIVWDWNTRERKYVLEGHSFTVMSLAFFKGDRYLASGSLDGTVRIWDMRTGKLVRMLINPENKSDGKLGIPYSGTHPIRNICVFPNDKQLVAANDKHQILVWDISDLP